jgi:hypothetical protein
MACCQKATRGEAKGKRALKPCQTARTEAAACVRVPAGVALALLCQTFASQTRSIYYICDHFEKIPAGPRGNRLADGRGGSPAALCGGFAISLWGAGFFWAPRPFFLKPQKNPEKSVGRRSQPVGKYQTLE